MIEIGLNNIVKNYGYTNILNGLNLEIMTGERVAIVGRNGTGKSTILKIISGEENIERGAVNIRRGATVGYLEQIPRLTATDATTHDVLLESFGEVLETERHMRTLEARMATETDADALDRLMRQYAHHQACFESLDGYATQENLDRIATGFGIDGILDRPFNVLSGGQKTIVMLARTILQKPDILLLDEPTNHLDMRTLEWFEGYLAKYKGTVVIVSHDRYFLDKVIQKTVMLHRGMAEVFHGNYSFTVKEQERVLLAEFEQYKNQQKQIEAMEEAIARLYKWAARGDNDLLYRKAKALQRRLDRMEKMDRPQLEKIKIPLSFAGGRTGREVLRMENLSLSIGGLELFSDVTETIFWQEKVCLVGDNGSGKTTLIRALLDEVPPSQGSIFLAAGAKIGYIPQEIRFRDDKASVVDAFRDEYPCPEGLARNILAKFYFYGENVFKRVTSLSGGEKVLLKLAILVQKEINFLILDEPTNHIDIETREMLEEALAAYEGTLLFISHDRYFIQKLAGRVLAIEDGHISSHEGGYDAWRASRDANM